MSIIDEAYESIDKLEIELGENDDDVAELRYDISNAISDIKSAKIRADSLLEHIKQYE